MTEETAGGSVDETPVDAAASLRRGDAQAAVKLLEMDARNIPTTEQDLQFRWWVLGDVLAALQRPEEAEAAYAAASDTSDPAAVLRVAAALEEVGLKQLKLACLEHLAGIDPAPQHLSYLMSAYEDVAEYRLAREVLDAGGHEYDPGFAVYLHVLYSLLCGDVPTAEAHSDQLDAAIEAAADTSQLTLEKGRDALRRARTVREVSALDDWDLRGWHYVITGGVLLHISADGYQQMRGRYAYVSDSYERCRTALERLGGLLDIWGVGAVPVLGLEEPGNAALAEAAARLFGRDLEPFSETAEGIVVCYDLDLLDVDTYQRLARYYPGQILYSHTSRWTGSTAGFAADVTGFLHQSVTAPWDSRIRMLAPGQVERIPPHPGPPSLWADFIADPDAHGHPDNIDTHNFELPADRTPEVIAADLTDEREILDSAEPLWEAARVSTGQASAFETEGVRNRFWEGGPVPSGRLHL